MDNYNMATGPGRTYRYYPSSTAHSRPLYEFGFGLSLTTFHLTCRRHHPKEGKKRGRGGGGGEREGKDYPSLWYAFEREDDEIGRDGETVQRRQHGTGENGEIISEENILEEQEEEEEQVDEAMEDVNVFPLQFECLVKNTGERDGDAVVMVYHSTGEKIRAAADYPVPVSCSTFVCSVSFVFLSFFLSLSLSLSFPSFFLSFFLSLSLSLSLILVFLMFSTISTFSWTIFSPLLFSSFFII